MKDEAIQCWLLLIVLILLLSLLFYRCSNMQEEEILTSNEVEIIQQSLEKQKAEDCIIVRTSKGWVCKSINSNDIYMIGE